MTDQERITIFTFPGRCERRDYTLSNGQRVREYRLPSDSLHRISEEDERTGNIAGWIIFGALVAVTTGPFLIASACMAFWGAAQ